ncbi:hypothetical protein D1122_14885 [Cereibacter sphaeroides]|uniref:hypothetical protein n=1 Tax=Cereibacter sphaeroides TaxID=1063 RepID=UPI000E5A7A94|nr:hypothetical protein [Cereibacter sphaeroides]RHZ95336.1 hypothetical protein D1122_14885 [Cereibacter sphaeroides]
MMRIRMKPLRRMYELTQFNVTGDVLTCSGSNGVTVVYDFSGVGEGDVLPWDAIDNTWVTSNVTRVGGVLEFEMVFPHGYYGSTPLPNPGTVELENQDGPIPPYNPPSSEA